MSREVTLEQFRENEQFILEYIAPKKNLDPYKVGNAIILEINYMAGQMFEL
jgi:hypothetical protein